MSTPPNDLEGINAELAELEQKKLELEKAKQNANPNMHEVSTSFDILNEPTLEERGARIKAITPIVCLFPPVGLIMIWRLPKYKGHIITKVVFTLIAPFASLITWAIIYFLAIMPILHLIGVR